MHSAKLAVIAAAALAVLTPSAARADAGANDPSPYRCLIDKVAATPLPDLPKDQTPVPGHVKTPIPGIVLDVRTPGTRFTGAAGRLALGAGRLRPGDAFRTASVTKTFTAVAALRLVEQGRLHLDEPIGEHLDPALMKKIRYGSRITLRQLLDHTSGIADYVTDDPSWMSEVFASPRRTWTPRELAERGLRLPASFQPGKGYHYSDTGYVLAGLIIEKAAGKRLHQVYRQEILQPLGMRATYLEHWEPHRGRLSHPYVLDLDFRRWNPTYDTFGGGGLVSTGADLTRFIRGLFEGRVFAHAQTLDTMLQATPRSEGSYGLGIMRIQEGKTAFWGHLGAHGAFMLYDPGTKTSVTGTVNQMFTGNKRVESELISTAYRIAVGAKAPSCTA
ncbi:beta-lactamase family protein [Planomonospora sp. ID67723]|uniref:serine hydrolase domain-containing protein n=1 Tax=Planomonospora sp. ID67723 TaxID=2738134 RepID=UPI0018C36EB7|nr:serine hydrolase domain-containing protein [Planomonospora sp. ID67723]MBG0831732.1 beta-lactamase family protein [Planomonospora sp. ID67723]